MTESSLQNLINRIGAEHVERRLKTEKEHEAQLFGQGTIFFNLENALFAPQIIKTGWRISPSNRGRDPPPAARDLQGRPCAPAGLPR